MKNVKKVIALLLVIIMTMAVGITTVSAADDTGNTGKITIDNAVVGQTYTLYKLLDLEVDNADNPTAYKYTAKAPWLNFFTNNTTAKQYFDVSAQGIVTLKSGVSQETAAKNTAEAAKSYITQNNINSLKETKATSSTVTFEGLELGYFLVESDFGEEKIAALDTVVKEVTMKEKNAGPTNVKVIVTGQDEDGNDIEVKRNVAGIGETVNFKSTITVADGNPTNYWFHDRMGTGFRFNDDSLTIELTRDGVTSTLDPSNYELITDPTQMKTTDLDCTFQIKFREDETWKLKTNDVVVIKYSATVTPDIVQYFNYSSTENKSKITYDNVDERTWDGTLTYTCQANIYKFFTDQNGDQQALAGAEFVVYKIEGDKILYAQFTEKTSLTNTSLEELKVNAISGWTEDKNQATIIKSSDTGYIYTTGYNKGTYYLEETKAPAGYNPLAGPIELRIDYDENSLSPYSSFTQSLEYKPFGATEFTTADANYYDENQRENPNYFAVKVENKTGTELPETGGIGTILFIVFGSIAVIGTGLFLVVNKRMKKEEL